MSDPQSFDRDDILQAFTAMMADDIAGFSRDKIDTVFTGMRSFRSKAAGHDPVKMAQRFAALLLFPEFQANCIRIEILIRLAIAQGKGLQNPRRKLIVDAFNEIGKGSIGRAEDPPEDVFVGTVRTHRGNYRLLEGVWEANCFHLQSMLDTIATMPESGEFLAIHKSVHGLLGLSELLCERAGLVRYCTGVETKKEKLTEAQLPQLRDASEKLRFTEYDLSTLGISRDELEPFVFSLQNSGQLKKEKIGDTQLNRRPLVYSDRDIILIVPTAISSAIRYFILDAVIRMSMEDDFRRAHALQIAKCFSNMPILGGPIGAPIRFVGLEFCDVSEVTTEIDTGIFLHIMFITDNCRALSETGLSGNNPDFEKTTPLISSRSNDIYKLLSKKQDFVGGMTLVVSCGIGRGWTVTLTDPAPEHWRIEFVSAYDLQTLSWTRKFKPTSLFKILNAKDTLSRRGIEVFNINGLANLVAWTRRTGGQLVPHDQIPREFIGLETKAQVVIPQNCVHDLRYEVATTQDLRVVRSVDGRWVPVRRDAASAFDDDQKAPLYVSEDGFDRGMPMPVFLANQRAWWADVLVSDTVPPEEVYQRWRMVSLWLSRIAPVLDTLPGLANNSVLWLAKFEGNLGDVNPRVIDYSAARATIHLEVDAERNTVTTTTSATFDLALFNPHNIAEHALVDAAVEGFEKLAGVLPDSARHQEIVTQIVPNTQIRHSHAFSAISYREQVRRGRLKSVVYIEPEDQAYVQLEMGWLEITQPNAGDIYGKRECTAYLNQLVSKLTTDLVADLITFDRISVIRFVLENHELAAKERDNWSRTASAVLALHSDREKALQHFAEHEFELNAVFQGTRVIAEVANSSCPITGGRKLGATDAARLMAKAGFLFQIGGWSDAIHWEAMTPMITIRPLGSVVASTGFAHDIIIPHARAGSDLRVAYAAENYSSHFDERIADTSSVVSLDPAFEEAWCEQFGASFDDTRTFLDFVESIGREADELVIEVKRSAFSIVSIAGRTIETRAKDYLLDALSSVPTSGWENLPQGFEAKDRHLWRYRRRLSLLRRPLLQVEICDDPTYILAPGLVREAIGYQLAAYHQGDFPAEQITPKMKAWKDSEADRRGKAFSREVAESMENFGWLTEREVGVTKVLRRGLDRNYGDIDVLAWKPGSKRVLIIECKDVQFRKTYGEVAEQLADFRGENRSNGRPDYLLRHLDRVTVLMDHAAKVAEYVGAKGEVEIESHMVFKNPVPMEFALKRMAGRVQVRNFAQLSTI